MGNMNKMAKTTGKIVYYGVALFTGICLAVLIAAFLSGQH